MIVAEAMNTYNPVLSILKNKGYTVKILLGEKQEEIYRW